jgi:hypothetical protein
MNGHADTRCPDASANTDAYGNSDADHDPDGHPDSEEPLKAPKTQLRVVVNRLLGREDHRSMREVMPAELILRDWENLTRKRDEHWQLTAVCAADPPDVVSKREALGIMKERYRFNSEQAVVKYLERHGVEDLPDRSY